METQSAQISDTIPPSRQALAEALNLSAEILRNVELSELPLASIALKGSRLARDLVKFLVEIFLSASCLNHHAADLNFRPSACSASIAAMTVFGLKGVRS